MKSSCVREEICLDIEMLHQRDELLTSLHSILTALLTQYLTKLNVMMAAILETLFYGIANSVLVVTDKCGMLRHRDRQVINDCLLVLLKKV